MRNILFHYRKWSRHTKTRARGENVLERKISCDPLCVVAPFRSLLLSQCVYNFAKYQFNNDSRPACDTITPKVTVSLSTALAV